MNAFESYKDIEKLEKDADKCKFWLKDYEGLHFSIGENGEDKIFWAKEKDKYIYSNKRFNEPILCFDGTYRACCNKIQRKPNRIIIEIDESRDIAQEKLLKIKDYLKNLNFGLIQSSHNSKNGSDYLWIEFTRDITDNEAEKLLEFISSKFGGNIDLNFASSKRRFPILFATHWKYPKEKEIPIEYFEGKQIDYDSLIIPKVKGNIKTKNINGFAYKTFESKTYELENERLPSLKMSDFLKGKIEKERPIIQNFIPEESIIGIFGEPASLKSFVACNVSSCVSTGTKFLGQFKTRKVPVLYISSENPEKLDKKRFRAIFRGLNISPVRRSSKNLQIEYLPRKSAGLLSSELFFNQLKQKITDSNIKLIVIDTLSPLILDTDDNKASAIVEVFNNRLFPLVDEFKLSIVFLLHSQKTGKDFLGSVKLKASVDIFYECSRLEDNTLSLLCHKGREGEHNIELKVVFHNNHKVRPYKVDFNFIRSFEGKQSVKSKKLKQMDKAKQIILDALKDNELSYKDLIKLGENGDISIRTISRAINILYEKDELITKNGKDGGYVLT